jgi:hypothetical protein
METSHPVGRQSLGWKPALGNAARFWEPRRLMYNGLLATAFAVWVLASWPHFRPALTWPDILAFFGLAALANVCYSAAYLVDIPMQFSVSKNWQRWRWTLFAVGTLFALLLANYWIADEIYPYLPQ